MPEPHEVLKNPYTKKPTGLPRREQSFDYHGGEIISRWALPRLAAPQKQLLLGKLEGLLVPLGRADTKLLKERADREGATGELFHRAELHSTEGEAEPFHFLELGSRIAVFKPGALDETQRRLLEDGIQRMHRTASKRVEWIIQNYLANLPKNARL